MTQTKKSLWVVRYNNTEKNHEEVEGIIFYAHWSYFEKIPNFSVQTFLMDTWDINDYKIVTYQEYNTLAIEFYLDKYSGEKWLERIRLTFKWLIEQGADVVWNGSEDCSPYPNIFFDNENSSNIYSFYSPKVGMMCNSDWEDEILYITDDQLNIISKTHPNIQYPPAVRSER